MRRRREQPLGEELERMQACSALATAFRHPGATASHPDVNLERAELRAFIAQTIPTLPRKYREAFTMRDLEGLNLREIADATGLTVPAVKTRVHRARLRVRAAIADRWDVLPYGLTG